MRLTPPARSLSVNWTIRKLTANYLELGSHSVRSTAWVRLLAIAGSVPTGAELLASLRDLLRRWTEDELQTCAHRTVAASSTSAHLISMRSSLIRNRYKFEVASALCSSTIA